jgi:hydrogenase-4 membrane subunit HyfE
VQLISAFIAIFAYADIPLVIMAIRVPNVRTQHPAAVLETGQTAPMFLAPLGMSFLALFLIGSALMLVRMHQGTSRREADSLRRELHAN